MKEIRADLHIHTCLSPCGELEMVPTAIARQVESAGLAMIAICDHNSFDNIPAVAGAFAGTPVSVLPGIEITTREEVHILGLFGVEQDRSGLQALIDENLPGENDAERFGHQVVVDERDEPTALNTKLLIGATTLSIEEVVDAIHRFGGLAIASHIDREGFGLIGQLGFVPAGLQLDALEVSATASHRKWSEEWDAYPVITSSDAHRLADIGRSTTTFLGREATFEELRKAIIRQDGRRILVH